MLTQQSHLSSGQSLVAPYTASDMANGSCDLSERCRDKLRRRIPYLLVVVRLLRKGFTFTCFWVRVSFAECGVKPVKPLITNSYWLTK